MSTTRKPVKQSIPGLLSQVTYLPDRKPTLENDKNIADAFARVAEYRDGGIFTGYYSGSSEWERHGQGDELVMALEGSTTVVLFIDGAEQRVELTAGELVVVPQGIWHRFDGSDHLKVFTVTPQPTDHRLDQPEA